MARKTRRKLRKIVKEVMIGRSSVQFPLIGPEIADTLIVDAEKPLAVG
jgi:hypothetical protein